MRDYKRRRLVPEARLGYVSSYEIHFSNG